MTGLALTTALAACSSSSKTGGIDGAVVVDAQSDADQGAPLDASEDGRVPVDASADTGSDAADSSMDGPPVSTFDDRRDSAEWHSYGHDLFNHRANLHEVTLSVDNVAQLERKWEWGNTSRAVTGTPAYIDGSLYFGDYEGHIVSLDARTGAQKWRVMGPSQFLPMVTSSASVTEDRVYISADGAMVYCLRRSDGEILWSTKADQYFASRLWSSALLVDDLVIVGTGSQQVFVSIIGEPDFKGAVMAFDADDGSVRWRFDLTEGTGVTVTSSAAIDPARGLLFVGTGQQYKGATPYSDSLLALHYKEGEYAWHFQFTENDNYYVGNTEGGPDYDVLSTPVLYTAGGVDAVAVGDKGGRFVAMNRDTGAVLWARQLTVGGRHGGIMSSPAYHDGLIFLCAGRGETLDPNEEGTGSGAPQQSVLFALDVADEGKARWSTEIDSGCFAPVSYANGVVYLPTTDGHARAFDAATGQQIWNEDIGNPMAGGITIVDGRLYIPNGWDWIAPTAPGGVAAYGLPD